MPEAVASNSTRMPGGQPPYGWKQRFSEGYEEVDAMLAAFREMNSALYETKQDHSRESWGIYLIQGLIMDRLNAVSDQVRGYLGLVEPMKLTGLERGLDTAVLMRIFDIRAQALLDAGEVTDLDGPWPEGVGADNSKWAAIYYNALVAKALEEGPADLLTIGSYLPWLEMRIRRDLGVASSGEQAPSARSDEHPVNDDNQSLRNRLIAEQAEAGVSVSEISQAFGIKRATVERIIGRLTAEEEESRKAV